MRNIEKKFVAKIEMKQMNDNQLYELRLQKEIEEIEAQIKNLSLEKKALERQILKVRQVGLSGKEINRKNSVKRVMIERKVIDALRNSHRALSSTSLYKEAQLIDFELKNTTFRTHLHRMKARNLIQLDGKSGMWVLSKAPQPAVEIVLKPVDFDESDDI
jgi:hypothetical protein